MTNIYNKTVGFLIIKCYNEIKMRGIIMVDFPITINEITIMSSEIIPYIRKCESKNAIKYIIDKTSCSSSEAEEIVDEIKTLIYNRGFSNISSRTSYTFKTCPKCRKQYMYLVDHCSECGYSTQAYKNRMKKLEEDIETSQPKQPSNQVHCPYCNSTNVNRISSTKKAMSIIGFGILSNKIGKQWHCNNCKSDF